VALHIPPTEIGDQIAIAYNPLLWVWWPRIERKPPAGWRAGWSFTFLFVNYQRWWRYV